MARKRAAGAAGAGMLTMAQMAELTTLHRATLYRLIATGTFPQPVRLTRTRVAWRRADVLGWIESRETGVGQGPQSRPAEGVQAVA